MMNWIKLSEEDQIVEIAKKSYDKPQVIFKHSIRCSISSMALSRLERQSPPNNTDFYLLDLVNFRSISNKVAQDFNVHHESPQVLVIRNGECIYDESHSGINMDEISDKTF